MAAPKFIALDKSKLKKIPVGKPIVIPTNTNIHPAGNGKVVLAGEKHKEITDSINYAERIQRSLLASKILLDENLNDYFILYQPKDVVDGDFYWATKLQEHRFALLVADRTGHGVPGAVMSILNIACLREATLAGSTEPDQIFDTPVI